MLFVITFLTSIPAVLLYHPVLHDPHYIIGAGPDTRVFLGAFLELLLIVANIGTALALFPILKRRSEGLALGYVAARIVECGFGFIALGIISVLEIKGVSSSLLTLALRDRPWVILRREGRHQNSHGGREDRLASRGQVGGARRLVRGAEHGAS